MSTPKDEGARIYKEISKAVNGYIENEVIEGFLEEFKKDHSTLQQAVMRLVLRGVIEPLAEIHEKHEKTQFVDGRVEAAARLASEFIKVAEGHFLPLI